MELHKRIRTIVFLLVFTIISCGNETGTGVNPNPFENNNSDGEYVKLNYSSNSDSLFLKWELLTKKSFDFYQINSDKLNETYKVESSNRKFVLTHIPYNEVVPIKFSLISNEKSIYHTTLNISITGLDTVFAETLIPDRGSVTGGDGTYSIALPDGRSIFLMGDSYIGPVTNGSRSMQDHMFRNTYIMYDNGHVKAIYGANGEKSSAAVPPGITNEHQKWYWPGHGFVDNNNLYVFQTLMYQGDEGMWGFKYETTDILEYELPSMELKQTTTIPFKGSSDIHFGMAVLKENEHVYIYAQVDVDNSMNPISDVLVARTTMDNLYSEWEYFDGKNWSLNSANALKLSGLESVPVSSQFNVFKLKDKYVLLTQEKTFGTGKIYTFIADKPEGPWYNKKLIYKINERKNIFTYNAMAHPQFKKDGMILISYNVNVEDFVEQHKDVSTYRPRFIWIDISKIVEK